MNSERGDDAERAAADDGERADGDGGRANHDGGRANHDGERANGEGGDGEGYVHRPGQGATGGGNTGAGDASMHGASPGATDRELSARRGWVVVAALAFSLLVAPLLILWRPPGIPYWAALLALPMLPAILLGAVGVWATTRP